MFASGAVPSPRGAGGVTSGSDWNRGLPRAPQGEHCRRGPLACPTPAYRAQQRLSYTDKCLNQYYP